jgi:hypothetical protein
MSYARLIRGDILALKKEIRTARACDWRVETQNPF